MFVLRHLLVNFNESSFWHVFRNILKYVDTESEQDVGISFRLVCMD